MAENFECDVYLIDGLIRMPIHIPYVQGANAVPLVFHIRDFTIPSDATAQLFVKKKSGKEVYTPVTISGNDINVTVTTQMVAETGRQEAQIQIIKDTKIITTFLFYLDVQKSLVSGSAIESKDEYSILDQLIHDGQEGVEGAKTAAKEAKQSASDAAGSAAQAQGYADAASDSADKAAKSAADAKTHEDAASASQTAAKDSADNAKKSEDAAGQSAADAAQSKTDAQAARQAAESARDSAKGYKDAADTSAQAAAKSQQSAADSATQAEKSADTARDSAAQAEQAKQNAQAAQTAAESAQQSAETAAGTAASKAQEASGSADDARQSAEAAKTSEGKAGDWSEMSKSWAVGETGVRDDEATDNSKYWAGQSKNDATDAGASAQKAKEEADRAQSYAKVNAPDFYLDLDDMTLYQKGGVGVAFTMDEDAALYWKINDAAA